MTRDDGRSLSDALEFWHLRDRARAARREAMARLRRERAREERRPVQPGPPKPRRAFDAHVIEATMRVLNGAIVVRGRTAVAKHLGLKRSRFVLAIASRSPGLRERVRVCGLPP